MSWCHVSVAIATDTTTSEPAASWQKGVSRWNGSGYELPIVDVTETTPQGDEPPYTLPVDPNSAAPLTYQGSSVGITDAHQPVIPVGSAVDRFSEFDLPLSAADAMPEDLTDADRPDQDLTEELPPPVNDPRADGGVIGEAIETGTTSVDEPPLQEEVTRWYHYPVRWARGWKSHAEFGLDGSDGNADTLAIQTGLEMKRQTDAYTLSLDVDYRQASNSGATTEDNGRFNIDYDRLLGDSAWSAFGKFGMEWDKFKAFDLRVNVNGGLGYYFIRDDTTTLVSRFGAGASQEIGSPIDDWIAEAVFGMEAERQLTRRQKIKAKVDYFPAWEDFSDYRLVTDLSWEILLDGSENLSLKLAATDRYDSTPQGAKANDLYYSLLLLYKF